MAEPKPIVHCVDADEWRRWLANNAAESDGIRLAIAKKGGDHRSVSYAEAIDEALCVGWIDGQKWSLDEHHFLQGFAAGFQHNVSSTASAYGHIFCCETYASNSKYYIVARNI